MSHQSQAGEGVAGAGSPEEGEGEGVAGAIEALSAAGVEGGVPKSVDGDEMAGTLGRTAGEALGRILGAVPVGCGAADGVAAGSVTVGAGRVVGVIVGAGLGRREAGTVGWARGVVEGTSGSTGPGTGRDGAGVPGGS